MPKMKKGYKDQDQFRKIRNAQRKRYYGKTAKYFPRGWTEQEDLLVLKHNIADSELSAVIGRSVQAIQGRRWKLHKHAQATI